MGHAGSLRRPLQAVHLVEGAASSRALVNRWRMAGTARAAGEPTQASFIAWFVGLESSGFPVSLKPRERRSRCQRTTPASHTVVGSESSTKETQMSKKTTRMTAVAAVLAATAIAAPSVAASIAPAPGRDQRGARPLVRPGHDRGAERRRPADRVHGPGRDRPGARPRVRPAGDRRGERRQPVGCGSNRPGRRIRLGRCGHHRSRDGHPARPRGGLRGPHPPQRARRADRRLRTAATRGWRCQRFPVLRGTGKRLATDSHVAPVSVLVAAMWRVRRRLRRSSGADPCALPCTPLHGTGRGLRREDVNHSPCFTPAGTNRGARI